MFPISQIKSFNFSLIVQGLFYCYFYISHNSLGFRFLFKSFLHLSIFSIFCFFLSFFFFFFLMWNLWMMWALLATLLFLILFFSPFLFFVASFVSCYFLFGSLEFLILQWMLGERLILALEYLALIVHFWFLCIVYMLSLSQKVFCFLCFSVLAFSMYGTLFILL